MKVKKTEINLFVFYLVITIQVFTVQFESAGFISYLKYLICIFGIFYSFFLMVLQNGNKKLMKNEIQHLLMVPLFFVIISFIRSSNVHQSSDRWINEILFMVLPIIYAYGLINTLNYKQIEKAIFGTLIISFLGYYINLNLSFGEFIKALVSVSFGNSESLLESSQFAGTAIAVALYYLYYRKNKFAMILSIIFVFLTFKRLAIITVIILFFLCKFVDLTKPISNRKFRVVCLSIFLISIVYFQIMKPENSAIVQRFFGNNFDKFTMSRYWRFSLLFNDLSYVNYGLGSTFDILMSKYNFSLEMDICKLLIEVGYIGVIVFIYNYFYSVKRNAYCTVLMLYLFLNMITSHCLASMFSWIIIFMTIGTIQYINPNGVKPVIKV